MLAPENIALAAVMVTWTLSCFHLIRAHVGEPGASPHRPYWKNKYSEAGKRHLRLHFVWAVATFACVLILLNLR